MNKDESDLIFPVSKASLPDPEPRSMDDYAKIVLMNLRNIPQAENYREQRLKESVNVPFHLAA